MELAIPSPAKVEAFAGRNALAVALFGGIVAWYIVRSRELRDLVAQAVAYGGPVPVRLTGYWPYQPGLSGAALVMEGGKEGAAKWRGVRAIDRLTGARPQLYTLEQYLRGQAPYVSVSGDPDVWPFGQRIEIDAWPGVVFRVVDTGGHFTGAGKVYRVVGREPLDICVDSSQTVIPNRNATATPVAGDAWGGGEIVYDNILGL